MNNDRRVVVTGLGIICAVGNTSDVAWANLLAGKSGVRHITSFDVSDYACKIAAEVRDFDPLTSCGERIPSATRLLRL